MRLIVASTRMQQRRLERENPDDKVVVVGDALHAIQVTEIVDETFLYPEGHWKHNEEWWKLAQCRVLPQKDRSYLGLGR